MVSVYLHICIFVCMQAMSMYVSPRFLETLFVYL